MSGLSDKLTGKAKQAAGKLKNDNKLKAEGKAQEIKGAFEDTLRKAAKTVTDTVDEAKKKIEK